MSSSKTTRERFQDILTSFDNAMLVTRTADGQLRSRPMRVADAEAGGDLWFVTARGSVKTDEIDRHPHVNVAMQSGSQFLSLSGKARLVDDRSKIDQLWSETWKVWFPEGKADPDILLIHVAAHDGEYWNNSGLTGLKYLVDAGRAYFSGKRMDIRSDPDQQETVDLNAVHV